LKENLVKDWSEGTYRKVYKQTRSVNQFNEYLAYTKLTPEQLIKEQRERPDERIAQRRTLKFYKWLQKEKGRSEISAFDYTKCIRSFYKYYGLPLSFRPSELERPASKMEDYRLKLNEIQSMVDAGTIKMKAIILFLESTGLRIGDTVRIKRETIEPLLDQEPPIGLEIPTAKKRVKAYPFLHKSAVETLKKYLATRTDNNPYLFVGEKAVNHILEESVLKNFKYLFRRVGLSSNGKRIRTHCLRKFLISRLQDVGVPPGIWKQIVGKTNKEAAYSSERLKESYCKALSRIDPSALSNNHTKVKGLEAKVEFLEKQLEQLRQAKGLEVMEQAVLDCTDENPHVRARAREWVGKYVLGDPSAIQQYLYKDERKFEIVVTFGDNGHKMLEEGDVVDAEVAVVDAD